MGEIGENGWKARFAGEGDIDRVNEIRRQVNELHVKGRPDIFKPGFPDELRDLAYGMLGDANRRIAVAERGGRIGGYAVLHRLVKPETPFMYVRESLEIDEFGVDEKMRRQGAATELIRFIKEFAERKGYGRIELNMWEFNAGALAFYEAAGFSTYRRYMEMKV